MIAVTQIKDLDGCNMGSVTKIEDFDRSASLK